MVIYGMNHGWARTGACLLLLATSACGADERDDRGGPGGIGPLGDDGAPASDDGVESGEDDAGQDDAGQDDSGELPADDAELLFLSVEPAELVVELDLGEPSEVDFVVLGHYDDGTTAELTETATLSAAQPAFGSVQDATLTIEGHDDSFFGSTVVQAQVDGLSAAAQITLAVYRRSGAQQDFFFVGKNYCA